MSCNYSKLSLSIKNVESSGFFNGYASIYNYTDEHNDIIEKGAFSNLIRKNITILWQHDPNEPIGKVIKIEEHDYGLYISAELVISVSKGYEAYELLKSGVIDSLSIGYFPMEYYYDEKNGTRHLTSIDLREISLVTFPSNVRAKVTKVCNKSSFIQSIEDARKKLKNIL